MAGPTKEMPWCTIFLVVSALVAHVLVLWGNLSTARMLHGIGSSTKGWSHIGTSLANSMERELDPAMTSVMSYLTETISVATEIEQSLDVILSMNGAATDAALAQLNTTTDVNEFRAKFMGTARRLADELFAQVSPLMDRLMKALRPALDQIEHWLTSFGGKIQLALEQFGTTLDHAQKLFDQVLSQASPSVGSNEEDMVYNTYTLFDTDQSGTIYPNDLRSIAQLYGISALAGNKAKELFEKYDADVKGGLDEQEYTLFTSDPSIPGIMTVVLRTYSQKLADIAGRVRSSKMRDELALAVVDYLTLVCAKNMTRVGWVSQALTNGSLSMQFTADILKELSMVVDNPNSLTLVDVGGIVVREMMRLNPEYVMKVLLLMSNPVFWASEGFAGIDQPIAVQRVVQWVANTPQGPEALANGTGLAGRKDTLAEVAFQKAKVQQDRYQAEQITNKAIDQSSLYASNGSKALRDQLLAGTGAAATGNDPEAELAVSRGQMALPATLQFAEWLANNATATADRHLQECFEYSGESSGALDSFAKEVNGMFARVQNFLNVMSSYASPQGIDRLVNQSANFTKNAALDLVMASEVYVDAQLAEIECQLSFGPCNMTAAQKDMSVDLTGAFSFVTHTLHGLKTTLPTVIGDLKFARQGVARVSNTMKAVMEVMGMKAPPVFYHIAKTYKGLWVAYFVFFTLLSLGVLFYGFWAAGHFGGPQALPDESYEAPRSLGERLRTLCSSCCACFRNSQDSGHLCFWSVLLIVEVIVLVLFLISATICLVGGLQAFLANGCSEVYILGDNKICTASLRSLRSFLKTFWVGFTIADAADMTLEETCSEETLMTCKLIEDETTRAVKVSSFGSVVAAVLSFHMIVESAIVHERSRWRRLLRAEEKKTP